MNYILYTLVFTTSFAFSQDTWETEARVNWEYYEEQDKEQNKVQEDPAITPLEEPPHDEQKEEYHETFRVNSKNELEIWDDMKKEYIKEN
jgi:hypothetical protein